MTLSAQAHQVQQIVTATDRVRDDVVNVETLSLAGQVGLSDSTSLALVGVSITGCRGSFLPVLTPAVMGRGPAFPAWMVAASSVLGLPRRVARLATELCWLGSPTPEGPSALTALLLNTRSARPACFGAEARVKPVHGHLESGATDITNCFFSFPRRPDLATAGIPAGPRAERPRRLVGFEWLRAACAVLYHAFGIAHFGPFDAAHIADIRRRLGRASGDDTPLFAAPSDQRSAA